MDNEQKPDKPDKTDEHDPAIKMSGFGAQLEVPTNGPGKWVVLALALCMVLGCLGTIAVFIIGALRGVPAIPGH